jgi:hypothetical protein
MCPGIPFTEKHGDKLCIVLGCRQLLLLRRINDHLHIFIGGCYLKGHSLGEALLGPQLPEAIATQLYVGHGRYVNVSEDVRTGCRTREHPIFKDLGIDLTSFRERLETDESPYLDIDVDEMNKHLMARGVRIESIELV